MQISTISTVCYYLPELVENSLFEQEKTFFRNLNSDDILFFKKKGGRTNADFEILHLMFL